MVDQPGPPEPLTLYVGYTEAGVPVVWPSNWPVPRVGELVSRNGNLYPVTRVVYFPNSRAVTAVLGDAVNMT